MKRDVNWEAIKTEYASSNTTFRKLGEKYDVPYSTIATRAKKENWEACSEQVSNKTEQLLIEKAVEKKVDDAARMAETADRLMGAIVDALNCIDLTSEKAPAAIRSLTSALKDLREVNGLNRTKLDVEEQKARIANLRKQAQEEEHSSELMIRFEGVDESWVK